MEMNKELHRVVLAMERHYEHVLNGVLSEQDWRVGSKYLIEDMIAMHYDLGVGVEYRDEPWSFMGSVYFVLTTTSTIGYGYPAPKTTLGKIFSIILYLTGVPLCFLAVTAMADVILITESWLWLKLKLLCERKGYDKRLREKKARLWISIYKRFGRVAPQAVPIIDLTVPDEEDIVLKRKKAEKKWRIKQDEIDHLKQYNLYEGDSEDEDEVEDDPDKAAKIKLNELHEILIANDKEYHQNPRLSLFDNDRQLTNTVSRMLGEHVDLNDSFQCSRKQLILTLAAYTMLGAFMYTEEMKWKYIDALHFLASSMSTVGFGDLTPVARGREFTFGTTIFILSGIGLLARLVTDIRRKFNKMINKFLDDILTRARASRDRLIYKPDYAWTPHDDIDTGHDTYEYDNATEERRLNKVFNDLAIRFHEFRLSSLIQTTIAEPNLEPSFRFKNKLWPSCEGVVAPPPSQETWRLPRQWLSVRAKLLRRRDKEITILPPWFHFWKTWKSPRKKRRGKNNAKRNVTRRFPSTKSMKTSNTQQWRRKLTKSKQQIKNEDEKTQRRKDKSALMRLSNDTRERQVPDIANEIRAILMKKSAMQTPMIMVTPPKVKQRLPTPRPSLDPLRYICGNSLLPSPFIEIDEKIPAKLCKDNKNTIFVHVKAPPGVQKKISEVTHPHQKDIRRENEIKAPKREEMATLQAPIFGRSDHLEPKSHEFVSSKTWWHLKRNTRRVGDNPYTIIQIEGDKSEHISKAKDTTTKDT